MVNLSSAEFEIFAFFEKTPDLVCIADKTGFFKKVNPAVIEKLGYSQEELFSRPISSFIYAEDKDLTHKSRAELLQGKTLHNFENRYITKSGKIVWFEWTSIYFPDKEIVFAIAKDITVRKEAQQEIEGKYRKYKSLATHFKASIEQDRKYLAIELHEELAQLASVVKMDLDWININTRGLAASSVSRLEHALIMSDLLINTIRRISFSISPAMLADLGLNAALEWQCKEFSILNGITCQFESAYDEQHLSYEIRLDFFRICQESLSNIMFHAQATHVKIRVEETAGKISLLITDDGIGFDVGVKSFASGLMRMRERAASINAWLTIESQIGKGTVVCVVIAK